MQLSSGASKPILSFRRSCAGKAKHVSYCSLNMKVRNLYSIMKTSLGTSNSGGPSKAIDFLA